MNLAFPSETGSTALKHLRSSEPHRPRAVRRSPRGGRREVGRGARRRGIAPRKLFVQSADAGGRVEGHTEEHGTASASRALRGLRALACAYTPCTGTGRAQDWPPEGWVVRIGKSQSRRR